MRFDRDRILELGRQGLKLKEISKETGASIPRVSEILREEGIKSHFYLEYERHNRKPYEGHHGRPVKSDFPKGYVTASEAGRILDYGRQYIPTLVKTGKLEGEKMGPYILVSLESIHSYADNIFKDAVNRGQKLRKL